jgi:RimJ/RimL family protein N-acetyltransferase
MGENAVLVDSPRWDNSKPIGLVYLTASQQVWDPLHVGELSIGIIIQPEHRGKGYGREVVSRVASIAFDHGQGHRLQAILLGHVAIDRALSLFTKM